MPDFSKKKRFRVRATVQYGDQLHQPGSIIETPFYNPDGSEFPDLLSRGPVGSEHGAFERLPDEPEEE
jgi:hypothetical protein